MPVFKVRIERDYVVTEDFTRYIAADDIDVARDLAAELALASDMDCPDDVSETGGGGAGDFCVMDLAAAEPNPGEEVLTWDDIKELSTGFVD